ncbi:hypothetical protein MXB_4264 [Myxobolus squamalis]|nr:hypothetical protein MXB_4264 [Myxobolus squamalis]
MVYDRESQLYVPYTYSLQTSKMLAKYTWMSSIITVYFEKGLLNAFKHEFSEKGLDSTSF